MSAHSIAASSAINELGGVSSVYTVSYYEYSNAQNRCFSDIYFSPGKNTVHNLLSGFSDIKKVIPIGYINSYKFENLKSKMKFILVSDDFSHIFEIRSALERNEIICMTGDRYIKNSKYLTQVLLAKEARFPEGPFLLALKLKVPVLFVYVMKERNSHYHLYARNPNVRYKDVNELLKSYVKNLEWILSKYPFQWFNYFDFWETNESQ